MQPFCPVAASVAVARLVTGPPRPVEVVAATPLAYYLATGDPDLPAVGLITPEAVRVPCALVLPAGVPLPPPGSGLLGGGRLAWPGFAARVARWWRPARPRWLGPLAPPAPEPVSLAPPASGPEADEGALDDRLVALVDALRAPGPPPVDRLIGWGPGLTPLGDDMLAGLLVALVAAGHPAARRLGRAVDTWAPGRTTLVSVALLRHAARGECIPELAAAVRGEPVDALLRVGHTSGQGLVQGVRAGHRLLAAAVAA